MSQGKKKRIGFIGLGSMGKGMATNLLKAGFPLTVFDIRQEPLLEMQKLGAKPARSAREVGEKSDVVIVMVRNYSQVKEAILPPQGALGGMPGGSTLIITSTISPRQVKEAAEAARHSGVALIDAPVSGGREKAEEGSLSMMVGGDDETVKNNENILKAMARHVYYVGKAGHGQAVKMINQMLVSANLVSVAEAVTMAKKLDLNLPSLIDIISKSAGDSFILRYMAPKMIAGDFEAKSAISLFTKDTRIIMETGLELGVPLPASSVSYQTFRLAESRGLGQKDASALIKVFEELAG